MNTNTIEPAPDSFRQLLDTPRGERAVDRLLDDVLAQPQPPERDYTVAIGFNDHNAARVTVRARSIEEACRKAVNGDEDGEMEDPCWKRTDHVGGTFVDAIAEGKDADPWADGTPAVPSAFGEIAATAGFDAEQLAATARGARDALREAAKQFRATGDAGHSTVCDRHADALDAALAGALPGVAAQLADAEVREDDGAID